MTEGSYPPHSILRKVGSSGNLGYQGKLVQVGTRWAGAQVRIIPVGDLIHVYYGELLIRALTIDPDRYYRPMPQQTTNGRSPTATTSLTTVR